MTATPPRRVILLTSASTYRAEAFLAAARSLDLEVVRVLDMPEQLSEHYEVRLAVEFSKPAQAAADIARLVAEQPVAAIISVDDAATELAALANELAGLPANDPNAARAARDKYVMRSQLAAGGVKTPWFKIFPADGDPSELAAGVAFPCVVKPRRLSGSRGVIRADNAEEFAAAFNRLRAILSGDGEDLSQATILVEEYLPGDEVAVEGLLTDGELHVLAIFDKPDPLIGPFFEETIYVTPSRHSTRAQQAIADEVAASAAALGLRHGPIHAELRVYDERAWLLEVAGRSIGGL